MAARKSPAEGRKGDKLIRDAIMVAIKRVSEDADGKKTRKLTLLADKLVEKAIEGDIAAIKEVGDRIDGKPRQEIDHASQDGSMSPVINLVYEKDAGRTNGHDRSEAAPEAGPRLSNGGH